MKLKTLFAAFLCLSQVAPTLAGNLRDSHGNIVGSVSEGNRGDKTYSDRYGNQRGTSSTNSQGETVYKDKYGNSKGRANANSSGETTYRDQYGNIKGTAKTDSWVKRRVVIVMEMSKERQK